MLRGIKSEVPILKNSMIEHCCHTDVAVAYMGGAKTWEQAKGSALELSLSPSCKTQMMKCLSMWRIFFQP